MTNVRHYAHSGKVFAQYCGRFGLYFAEKVGPVAYVVKPFLKTSNSRKETCYSHFKGSFKNGERSLLPNLPSLKLIR